jgi:hypothetical protein
MGSCFNKKEEDDEEKNAEQRKKSQRGHINAKNSLVSKTDRQKNDEISRPYYVYPNQSVNDKIQESKFMKLYF